MKAEMLLLCCYLRATTVRTFGLYVPERCARVPVLLVGFTKNYSWLLICIGYNRVSLVYC